MIYESPIGTLTVSDNGTAVTKIAFGTGSTDGGKVSRECIRQLEEYFSGQRKTFSLPLHFEGSEFQKSVWKALMKIPYGATCTYSDIAECIGNPKACRAVGMANNKNPIVIVAPCHRVVGKDGSLTGYGGGLDKKRYLLNLEKINTF